MHFSFEETQTVVAFWELGIVDSLRLILCDRQKVRNCGQKMNVQKAWNEKCAQLRTKNGDSNYLRNPVFPNSRY